MIDQPTPFARPGLPTGHESHGNGQILMPMNVDQRLIQVIKLAEQLAPSVGE